MADISTKPYLIRAIHEWCEDSGYRPYIAVVVDEHTQVPAEFVRNGEIVLNVSAQATHRLRIGNDFIEFEARFSGTVRSVSIPIDNVSAIYAQETGHGMAFDVVRTQSPRPAPARAPSPVPIPVPRREATSPEGRAEASVPARGSEPHSDSGSRQSAPRSSTKPRLVPKVAAPAPDERSPAPEPLAAKVVSDASTEAGGAPARKPRAPRRRSKPTPPPDTASGDKAAPQQELEASTPTAALEPATSAQPSSAAPSGSGGPPNEPPNAPPSGPAKPARGHLKRVK
jgi:stringent starvation protein B